jgi:hypothetical protein
LDQDSILLIDYYQSGVLLISPFTIEEHFEGKSPREIHQGCLVLARHCPGSPGSFNPKNVVSLASNVLITHPSLRIWPRQITSCFLGLEDN